MNSEIVNFFLAYIQHEKRCSDHTTTAYRNDMSQFSHYLANTYDFHHPQLADHQMIRSWVVSLSEAKLDSRSINRKVATLRSFYKFLLFKKIIDQDPMRKVVEMKTAKNIPTFVRESEMEMLLDKVEFPEDFEGVRDKLIMELLYGSGIRLSELIELEVKDIDFYQHTIKVLGKRNKERIVPIHANLSAQIKEYIEIRDREGFQHHLLIVSNKGEQGYPVMIQRIVKKYLSLVTSLTKKSPHVLRHSYATHLLNNGADLTAIKDLMGHTSLAATQVYTHNSMEKLKKIYEQAHPKA